MPKSISITQIEGKPGQVYYPLSLDEVPKPSPKHSELLIKISAAALNHRDLFIRQHLYPGTAFGIPLLTDGSGVVESKGPTADNGWIGKKVVVNPGAGWKDSLDGPEDPKGYMYLGGTKTNPNGTLQEYIFIDKSEVEEAPSHLTMVENAALPLTGLTAWRAVMVKCGEHNLSPGRNILITGIGGGVALMALTFATAAGVSVWVISSNQVKIDKAVKLGAQGGVIYKEEGWEKKLLGMLASSNKQIDAIIDGAGGDSIEKATRLLKPGGVLSIYGMTVSPKMPFLMQAVMKNIEVKGSTGGSRKEFKDMISFIKEKKAVPIVIEIAQGLDLDAINGLFDVMKKNTQFGKLCVEISKDMEPVEE